MHSSVLFGWATMLLASSGALAHMEMTKPAPLRSKFNKSFLGSLIDYDMVRPLDPFASGQYPCFGYHKDDNSASVETYKAGGTYQMEIAGGAAHNGGSCQLSLSYDNGQTFHVIKSMIGSCPLKTSYSFTIPSDVPSKKGALFAWTWFNKTGNREMYMNCARVDVEGGSGGSLSGPEIFKANIADTQCKTEEGKDPIFPNPGPDVEYGDESLKSQKASVLPGCEQASGPSQPPAEQPPAEENNEEEEEPVVQLPTIKPPVLSNTAPVFVAPPPTSVPAASSTPAPPVQQPAPVPTPSSEPVEVAPPATLTTIKTPLPTHDAPSAAPAPGGNCDSGAIVCGADGNTWSVCNNGQIVSMGSVAAGMTCVDGKMVLKGSSSLGTCSGAADGETSCNGSNWAVCVNGTWVDMGAIAPGSTCNAGKISQKRNVHARRHIHRRAHGMQKHF